MIPKDEIKARLKSYPNVRNEEDADSIRVRPIDESGFEVSLYHKPTVYTVTFEGWHEDFSSPEEALECFAFGLSDECRLKVTMRGHVAQRWTLEPRKGESWIEESTTGLIFFPFWRRSRIIYKRNNLIKEP